MTQRFLVNPGTGRRVVFHGTFKRKPDAQRKERQVGGFIRPRKIGRATYYMVLSRKPRGRRGNPAHNPAPLEARNMARRRSRSRRRKGTARRPRRRAVARVTLSNPRKRRRRGGYMRRAASRGRRRSYRRNPPIFGRRGGFLGRLMGALVDGLTVTGGVVGQNAIVRYVPNLIPATVPSSGLLNSLTKDVLGILVGSWGAHQLLGADRARFVVAGQAHAAIARGIRAANIPTVSTLMGEYDPIYMGTYTPGVTRRGLPPQASPAALAAGNGGDGKVRTLRNVGIYTEGVSFAPSLY